MSEHCNVCGSMEIQETCYLCGSLNNNAMPEDGFGSGSRAGDASVQNDRFHGFIMVPIPPPAIYTALPQYPHPNVSTPSSSPAEGGSTPIRRCISDVLPAASPPRTGIFSYAQGELPKPFSRQFPYSPHSNVSSVWPSPAKSGYAELPPRPPLRRCISDVLPVASAARIGVISSTHGDMLTGSPVMSQESLDHERLKTSRKIRDPTTPEDGSGDGQPQPKKREKDSRVPVPPPSFCINLCSTPPLSPSPKKGGSTELLPPAALCLVDAPPRTGDMSSGQGDLPKPSSSQNLPSSPQAPRMNPNVSPLSESPAKGVSAEWPPLPVLRRSVSDLLPFASPPRTGHDDMPVGSSAITRESLDHKEEDPKEEQDEEVSIEKDGEYLRIYLKCPCSKAFQLLLSGSHCYYRLM